MYHVWTVTYRGCADGNRYPRSLDKNYIGCKRQSYGQWNNTKPIWCLCDSDMCNIDVSHILTSIKANRYRSRHRYRPGRGRPEPMPEQPHPERPRPERPYPERPYHGKHYPERPYPEPRPTYEPKPTLRPPYYTKTSTMRVPIRTRPTKSPPGFSRRTTPGVGKGRFKHVKV